MIAESLVKVTLFIFFVIIVPVMLVSGIGFSSLPVVLPVFLLVTAILMFIGYAINAMANSGKYCAIFSMDNEKIIHTQSKKQVDKGRLLAIISTLAFNDSATGLSLLSNEKFTTSYQNIKNIRIEPDKNLIRESLSSEISVDVQIPAKAIEDDIQLEIVKTEDEGIDLSAPGYENGIILWKPATIRMTLGEPVDENEYMNHVGI